MGVRKTESRIPAGFTAADLGLNAAATTSANVVLVDELTIKEYPFVTFRINANTWVECAVNYLVDPKKSAATRSAIIKKAITTLLQQPDKVMFPKTNNR